VTRVPADKLPALVGAELDGGTYAIFEVVSSRLPDKQEPEHAAAQSRALLQTLGAADDGAYLTALRSKHKAEVLRPELRLDAKAAAAK
jgi:hypothetical protein